MTRHPRMGAADSDNPESFADLDGHCMVDWDCIFSASVFKTAPSNGIHDPKQPACARGGTGSPCLNQTNTGATQQSDQQTATQQAQKQGASQSSGTATFNLGGTEVKFAWSVDQAAGGVLRAATPTGCDS